MLVEEGPRPLADDAVDAGPVDAGRIDAIQRRRCLAQRGGLGQKCEVAHWPVWHRHLGLGHEAGQAQRIRQRRRLGVGLPNDELRWDVNGRQALGRKRLAQCRGNGKDRLHPLVAVRGLGTGRVLIQSPEQVDKGLRIWKLRRYLAAQVAARAPVERLKQGQVSRGAGQGQHRGATQREPGRADAGWLDARPKGLSLQQLGQDRAQIPGALPPQQKTFGACEIDADSLVPSC